MRFTIEYEHLLFPLIFIHQSNINTNYIPATTSGTATWFAVITIGVAGFSSPLNILQSIYGNIGAIGSGADLEMSSNAIVAGQQYRITNLVLQFPNYWTY